MDSIQPRYQVKDNGDFIVENYNWAKPFSNFFPGIAGETGVPMWVYYVNRAQAICSCGFHNKDHAIMEFLSFNKACQVVGQQGFRTFIRMDDQYHEPFIKTANTSIQQRLIVSSSELNLVETYEDLGLHIQVSYFPLPNRLVSGLVRAVVIENRSNEPHEVEFIDGLSRILPYGVSFEHTKVTARHIEAMMGVEYRNGYPIFRLKQTPDDIERIGMIEAGHFYVYHSASDHIKTLSTIVDPSVLFGDSETLDQPWQFMQGGMAAINIEAQSTDSRTPCAFTGVKTTLDPGESFSLNSIVGAFTYPAEFDDLVEDMKSPGFFVEKRDENFALIESIKNTAFSVSSEPRLDQYAQQTFLENVMRGGMPLILTKDQDRSVFYTYARQNGDLERDYHWFILEPTYLSQGNSHYRNMLQNRRVDPWFFPAVEDHNVLLFMNLIQLDGYNPLEIKSVAYRIRDEKAVRSLFALNASSESKVEEWLGWVRQPFTPGEFLMKLHRSGSQKFSVWRTLLAQLLPLCDQEEVGSLHEGFWIDHWFYNLDLIESVLSIYPDRVQEIFIENETYTFFDNPDVVQPRKKKTVQVDNKIRQYHSVVRNEKKAEMINARSRDANKVRTDNGKGEIYSTNLLVKWLSLIANKFASLDPSGIGLEMEAGKPGWCDSLNGLPGLFGSSICETLEIVRACRLILDCLDNTTLDNSDQLGVYKELAIFLQGLMVLLHNQPVNDFSNQYHFWDQSHALREAYLQQTRFGISGTREHWSILQIRKFLERCLDYLNTIFQNDHQSELYHPSGVPYTYFINPHKMKSGKEQPVMEAQQPVTPFLEGPVHYLRVYPEKAKNIYEAVRNSGLYDPQLAMYRCCELLDDEPYEIGRIKAYPQGWLENASVYTHMEYKWLLEVLRSGLFEEFFRDLQTVLVPFQHPDQYGRSTFENCSFIVSSLFSDKSLHGQAYQPRLSGMTCEYLHMWTLMATGSQPFFLDDEHQLCFSLMPKLAGWLFTENEQTRQYWDERLGWRDIIIPENTFTFKFMNQVLVVYHNPARANTYGDQAVNVVAYHLHANDGSSVRFPNPFLPTEIAHKIRLGEYHRIDVQLA